MSTQPKPYITPEQYLEIERAAEYKSEYFDGEMFAMSGVRLNHARITHNLDRLLGNQLLDRQCLVATSELRVRTQPRGPCFYPDLVVVCGKLKLADDWHDMLTDATVIIEVLSPSTERYDRTFKFEHYARLASLTDYIVVAQERMHVEQKTRQEDGSWAMRETSDAEAVIEIRSIGCSFRVGDAYRQVEFAPPRE